MKDSFILYLSQYEAIKELSDEQLGRLMRALFEKQLGNEVDLEPDIKIAFNFISNQISADNKKYEDTCRARASAGSKGGKQRVANQAKASKSSKSKQKQANQADNDNDNESSKEDEEKIKKENDFSLPTLEIITHLNTQTGCSYKASSKETQKHIKARLREGYAVDDFKKVIDSKVADWGKDPKMQEYLRPSTLFGSKFESYLQKAKQVENTSRELGYMVE